MSYPLLAGRLYGTPWLIEPGKAAQLEAVFRAYVSGTQADLPPFELKSRAPVTARQTDEGYLLTDAGVAVLPILGTLVQRTMGLDALSGLTSYTALSERLQAALGNPDVKGIVLEIDSPGGEAAGVWELAGQIAAADKPISAHANEMAFSAAYALAAAAQSGLYLPQSGMVGSVGVIMMHVDQSAADAKRGLVYTPIFAGSRKADFSSHAPLSDRARATAQDSVDHLYGIFVDHVANARAIDPEAVRKTEAGLLKPGEAIDLRMADGIASLAETIQQMTDEVAPSYFNGYSSNRPSRASSERSNTMSTNDKTPGQAAATEEQLITARTEATVAATAAAEAKYPAIRTEGATAERARIKAILTADAAKDRVTLAQHLAFESDMAPDAAIAMLGKAAVEKPTGLLSQKMAGVDNPQLGQDVDRPAVAAPSINTANIYAMRRQASGHASK